MSAFDLPEGWSEELSARLGAGGWRTAASRAGSQIMTAAKPSAAGLVVVLELLSYRWPRPRDLRVTLEAGVGVETAMDLAAHLGWLPRHGAFFARDPDRLPDRTVCHGESPATAGGQVARAAEAAFAQHASRFRDATELDAAMTVQPRLLHTDLVTERVLILAAIGRTEAAFGVLRAAVDRLDDEERHDRGWRVAAARLHERLAAWIDDGSPPPPSWAAP